jgi:hypothetical protein
MIDMSKYILPSILFLLTLITGDWLSRAGKPYNHVLFNIHKLIALGTVVLTGIQTIKQLRGMEASSLVSVLLIVAALCIITLFASGALMSAGKLDYALMLSIHRIASIILVVGLGLVALFIRDFP